MISFEDPLKRKTAGLLTPVRRLLNGEPAHDARVYLLFAGKLASKKKISAALAAYGAAAPLQFKAGDAAGALRTAKLLLCFPEGGLLGAGLALDAAQEILAAGGAEYADGAADVGAQPHADLVHVADLGRVVADPVGLAADVLEGRRHERDGGHLRHRAADRRKRVVQQRRAQLVVVQLRAAVVTSGVAVAAPPAS